MAIDSMQPVGHLCDLLGISRCAPGVFDAMVSLLYGQPDSPEHDRDSRLAALRARLLRRA